MCGKISRCSFGQIYTLTIYGNDWLPHAYSSYDPAYIWGAKLWMAWLERALWTGQSLLVFGGSSKLVASLLYNTFFNLHSLSNKGQIQQTIVNFMAASLSRSIWSCWAKTVVNIFSVSDWLNGGEFLPTGVHQRIGILLVLYLKKENIYCSKYKQHQVFPVNLKKGFWWRCPTRLVA